ncbi:hypothetical protein ABTE19_20490, partial [Acinetobacter baumannii]
MSIVNRIMQRNGGRLVLTNRPSPGSGLVVSACFRRASACSHRHARAMTTVSGDVAAAAAPSSPLSPGRQAQAADPSRLSGSLRFSIS